MSCALSAFLGMQRLGKELIVQEKWSLNEGWLKHIKGATVENRMRLA